MKARKIMVTGASQGIGKALVEHFLALGDTVIGVSRSKSDIAAENYHHYSADVALEADAKRVFANVKKQVGALDVLINNAGIARMNAFALTPVDNVQEIMNTNFMGTFIFCQKAINLLRKSPNARIINLSTVAVPLNLAGEAAYAASKSAVETLTRIMAKELGSFGITCNAIGPSPIATQLISGVGEEKINKLIQQQAIKKMAKVEDVTNLVDFYLNPNSHMVSGQVIYLGGIS
ncbi:SDR family NAD(P)-dependent oxidoreductase [Paraglaciecola arctica]|uniref:SDR family NAD(P)-dependent oxidoreductase n=1 Tax=Paraglaciecola arctica TaxID=1128911 RepID=UPI001C067ABA|nr:SDR family oxidoreductase [Paraglaciecola arctica]MBU3005723.1 SDR family oxidoreductase [Paraglaciecola arctica]